MSILDRFSLSGKIALVTGASSGLGAGFAVALAEAGADVVLAARRRDRLEAACREIEQLGRAALAVQTDVTDPAQCRAAVQAAVGRFGRLDVLVNNAGLGTAVPALRETPEQFREVIDVNLMGAYWMAQAAALVMPPGSSIVNIASLLGLVKSFLPQAAYAASKAGLIGLCHAAARQLGPYGITSNAIAPGLVTTDLVGRTGGEALAARLRKMTEENTPVRRAATAEDVAFAALFLASDEASYVNGEVMDVNGGAYFD
jgi:NAD(P)-dependent dehydrogenase (short-subunit alcohol dehydrogenase family)